jgi:hypothetical protein
MDVPDGRRRADDHRFTNRSFNVHGQWTSRQRRRIARARQRDGGQASGQQHGPAQSAHGPEYLPTRPRVNGESSSGRLYGFAMSSTTTCHSHAAACGSAAIRRLSSSSKPAAIASLRDRVVVGSRPPQSESPNAARKKPATAAT